LHRYLRLHSNSKEPQLLADQSIWFYRYRHGEVSTWLESNSLLFDFEVAEITVLVDVVQRVIEGMTSSRHSYMFSSHRSSDWGNANPLSLLEFVDRGRPRPKDSTVRFRPTPIGDTLTVGSLVTDRGRFFPTAHAQLLTLGGRFHIFTSMFRCRVRLYGS
jgi:hypothetical protein